MMLLKQAKKLAFSSLKIVIVRHGETDCNKYKKWAGWRDAKLTKKGEEDAVECGLLLKQENLEFDLAYCSYLSRTIKTAHIILDTIDCLHIPVHKRWQLNEKFYGALQDEDKISMVKKYGEEKVNQWRRSYTIAPPKVQLTDPRHPVNDKKYKDVDPALLPCSESLGDVLKRVNQLFQSQIKKQLLQRKRLLMVCHGSVVRAMTNILLGFTHQQGSKLIVPNATPLVIDLDQNLKCNSWKLLGDRAKIDAKIKKLQNQLKQ